MRAYRLLLVLLLVAGLVSACAPAPATPPSTAPAPALPRATAGQAALAPPVAPTLPPTPAPPAALTTSPASWPAAPPPAPAPAYWPTDGWRTSTPEEQGMDSSVLASMIEMISRENLGVHGVVVVRHGYVVAEAYFHPYTGDIPHELASVTKTLTGALTGIAVGEGKIKGVDEKVLGFFPDHTAANPDPRKDAMTLRDLLTMRTGLDWAEFGLPFSSPNNNGTQMGKAKDWVAYVLDRPMVRAPGQAWNYNSGASHLISAILRRTTGQTEADYASSRLFGPLGITEHPWAADPQGVTLGFAGLRLRPRDMAKFGMLYLHGGGWDGRQVVPADWVRASLERPAAGGTAYGYQVWLDSGAFAATGMGGQVIWVDPGSDLVGAVVSGLPERQSAVAQDLMTSYARRAVKSDGPLPPDPAGQERLAAAQTAAAHPRPQPISHGPADAVRRAAQYCTWSSNSFGILGGNTTFGDGPEATSHICFAQGCLDFQVGLDGIYRVSNWGPERMAMRGAWQDEGAFVLQSQVLSQPGAQVLRMVPAEDGTTRITITTTTTGQTETVTCTPK